MDPDHFNQSYSRLSNVGGSLPPPGALNSYNLPILAAEHAGIAPGLGLGGTLSSHSAMSSAARALGPLPGMNYVHPMHSAQLLENFSPLSSIAGQGQYKGGVHQTGFFETSLARSSSASDQHFYGNLRFTSAGNTSLHSKSVFSSQDSQQMKDLNYSPTSLSSQSPLDTSPKGWNLSNFMQTQTSSSGSLITDLSTDYGLLSGSLQPAPPPAHSSKRTSTIQRNPYSTSDVYFAPKNTKSPVSTTASPFLYGYDRILDVRATTQSPTLTPSNSQYTSRTMEDLLMVQNQSNSLYSCTSSNFPVVKSESSIYTTADMNYDPVSPATPLSDAGQGQNENYVSLQDLASISSTQEKLPELSEQRFLHDAEQEIYFNRLKEISASSNRDLYDRTVVLQPERDLQHNKTKSKTASIKNMQQELYSHRSGMNPPTPNGQLQSTQSPLQQSPISVGGSPQSNMPLGSPQSQIPSSTTMKATPPIQAQADSTTGSKKVRGSKKKKDSLPDLKRPSDVGKISPGFLEASSMNQTFSQQMISPTISDTNFPQELKRQISSGNLAGSGRTSDLLENMSHVQRVSNEPVEENYFSGSQLYLTPEASNRGQQQTQHYIDSVIRPNSVHPPMHYQNDSLIPHRDSDLSKPQRQPQQQPSVLGTNHSHLFSHSHHLAYVKQDSTSIVHRRQQTSGSIHSPGMVATQPSPIIKQEPSPLMGPQPSPASGHKQSPHVAHQSSPATGPYQQSSPIGGHQISPLTPNSHTQYSVSETLPMDQVNMVINTDSAYSGQSIPLQHHQQLLRSYSSSTDLSNPYGMEVASNQNYINSLGIVRSVELTSSLGNHEAYQSHSETIYATNEFGSAFVNPQTVIHMDSPLSESPDNRTSTIDEVALSSLMDDPLSREPSPEKFRYRTKAEQKEMPFMSITVATDVAVDEDLCHLSQPPTNLKEEKSASITHNSSVPPPTPKIELKPNNSNSFLNSYLMFLQGQKPETLSSVSSAIIYDRPQLPKYIPEPPRHRPLSEETPRSDDSVENRRLDSENESNFWLNSPHTSQNSTVTFSDDSDSIDVPSVLTSLNDNNDKVKISMSKTGGLTMKINLAKVKASENAIKLEKKNRSKSSKKSSPKSKKSKSKSKGRHKSGGYSSEEGRLDHSHQPKPETVTTKDSVIETVTPQRQLSSRKAKEVVLQRSKKASDSEEDSDFGSEILGKMDTESEQDYDSDKDPVWTPFGMDNRRQASFDVFDSEDRAKKSRISKPKARRSRKSSGAIKSNQTVAAATIEWAPPVAKIAKLPPPMIQCEIDEKVENQNLEKDDQSVDIPIPTPDGTVQTDLQVGDFVIEKRDLKNYETYPIWKIESGRMLHKFEFITEDGKILHRAIPTFSSWQPTMRNSYVHIHVKTLFKDKEKETVMVLDEYRPKPTIDTNLETAYEEDPLVDLFNVYLQVFLSQALEPGFLCAITESENLFYLAPVKKIDQYIEQRLEEIESKVRWRTKFKECLQARPHIRELDRPNLKQSCQACEFASQPAIKSIHLFGNPYNRYTLEDLPVGAANLTSQEFMIGKTAAKHVGPYHNLYHYKYNLYKRCLAKINILKDSQDNNDNATILDQCLQNRAWVLQIFEDLKKLLEKG
ncbi:hypothetical protein CHS0354_034229 [Potamilus streckersoni]|uniref:DUF4211 domain-containing protein n=1 Tax=Potamilus streckersoni TaxID=2493646 RepID=A0AAE0W734_9BIVA|nr:hypothetical protein CHS0354_034229 [Potamilus streckersoni]